MFKYTIYQDKKEITNFTDQKNDFCVLKWFMNKTNFSMSYAFTYDGYSVTVLNQETNVLTNY